MRRAAEVVPASVVVLAAVTDQPIDVATHEQAVAARWAGATAIFAGVVRDHDGGRAVDRLTYEAHPDAGQVVARIAGQVADHFPGTVIAVSHRVGALEITDVALVAAVASAHRGQAFAACAELVERVKASLPVWKHQLLADGSDEWVGAL